jgi:hypothetical protein
MASRLARLRRRRSPRGGLGSAVAAVVLLGCSGNPVPENDPKAVGYFGTWAGEYGCTQENAGSGVVMATNHRIQTGPRWKPEVGWDACELMFALGYPSKEDSQDTENGRYKSWWYHEYDEVHLVTLTFRPEQASGTRSAWIVTYVGW